MASKTKLFGLSFVLLIVGLILIGWTHGAGTGYSAQATQFFNRLANDPGTTQKNKYASAIDTLFAASMWTSFFDVLIWTCADTQGNAVINVPSTTYSPITINGSPTFTALSGFTGGTGKWLGSNFNPITASSPNFVQDSAHLANYTKNSISEVKYDMGSNNAVPSALHLFNFSAGLFYSRINDGTGDTPGTAVSDGIGVFIGVRTGSATTTAYREGSLVGTGTIVSNTSPNLEIFFMASNSMGSADLPATNLFSMFSIGKSMDATQAGILTTVTHDVCS